MGSIGTPEILLILVIALLLFGPQKLPELGKSLGRAIREFKKASSELQETIEREVEEVNRTAREEPKASPTTTPGLPAGAMPPPSTPMPPPAAPPEKAEEPQPPPPVEPR
jgi:sec-independent protein translocase protein TatA